MTAASFGELSWSDLEARLAVDCRVVLPLGATEEHGELSLTADTNFVDRLTETACERAGVVRAPVMPFGCSAFAITFPGTISMRTVTMSLVITDMIDSLYRQGFRRLVFVTGHGGNEVITGILSEAAIDRPGLATYYVNGWRGMAAGIAEFEAALGLPGAEHAAWHEAFDFNVVKPFSGEVHQPSDSPDFPQFPVNPRTARRYMPSGVQAGLSRHDDPTMMSKLFDACVTDLVSTLNSLPAAPPED
ncbi:creatininase family protein [Actinomadura roseirufa]|uniref:creatininase family protein n=1 Tax=Actinomadura roseirufa TaxID=2094049 RepID=UPI0010418C2E|nr:creatininase family protein [Actinomadura roseirufa]